MSDRATEARNNIRQAVRHRPAGSCAEGGVTDTQKLANELRATLARLSVQEKATQQPSVMVPVPPLKTDTGSALPAAGATTVAPVGAECVATTNPTQKEGSLDCLLPLRQGEGVGGLDPRSRTDSDAGSTYSDTSSSSRPSSFLFGSGLSGFASPPPASPRSLLPPSSSLPALTLTAVALGEGRVSQVPGDSSGLA